MLPHVQKRAAARPSLRVIPRQAQRAEEPHPKSRQPNRE